MEVRAAPSFTSSPDAISATCRIVVSYDWSSTRYFLPDHLNSTNVVTDASGSPIQILDYYPYGSTRISQTTGGFNEQKQYVGRYQDPETNLNYLQARYYDSSKGDFLSEDPVFWTNQHNLSDPQSLNSYSYGNDNPINRSDPNGLATLSGTTKAILSQLKTQLLGAAAYLQSIANNPRQFASNVAAGASVVRSNPMGVASAYGSAIRQSVSQNYRDLYYGNDATQDQALAANILFFGALAIPGGFEKDAASTAAVPQVLLNKAAGDAFRDSVAATMQQAGYDVQTEVYKSTGLGGRFIDIDVSKNGVNLGGVETKTGSSPYTTSQRAKDAWLKWTSGYIVTVFRNEP